MQSTQLVLVDEQYSTPERRRKRSPSMQPIIVVDSIEADTAAAYSEPAQEDPAAIHEQVLPGAEV
jgi:hypothetical protein